MAELVWIFYLYNWITLYDSVQLRVVIVPSSSADWEVWNQKHTLKDCTSGFHGFSTPSSMTLGNYFDEPFILYKKIVKTFLWHVPGPGPERYHHLLALRTCRWWTSHCVSFPDQMLPLCLMSTSKTRINLPLIELFLSMNLSSGTWDLTTMKRFCRPFATRSWRAWWPNSTLRSSSPNVSKCPFLFGASWQNGLGTLTSSLMMFPSRSLASAKNTLRPLKPNR